MILSDKTERGARIAWRRTWNVGTVLVYFFLLQYSTVRPRSVPSAFCSVLFQSDRYIEIEVLYENEIVCCYSRNITPEDEVQIEFCEENERERGWIDCILYHYRQRVLYCTVLYCTVVFWDYCRIETTSGGCCLPRLVTYGIGKNGSEQSVL